MLNLVPRPQSTFPPADLPVFSSVAPSPQPFTAPLHHDGPLTIHNHSVEEYQKLYHEVVDDMGKSLLLTSLQSDNYHILLKNLSLDFSICTIFNLTLWLNFLLELGHRIKQKLWERHSCSPSLNLHPGTCRNILVPCSTLPTHLSKISSSLHPVCSPASHLVISLSPYISVPFPLFFVSSSVFCPVCWFVSQFCHVLHFQPCAPVYLILSVLPACLPACKSST